MNGNQHAAELSLGSKLGGFVRFLLGDVFLGFLAILAAALTVFPLAFKISPRTDALLEGMQWVIIALFAVEYLVGLARAPSKTEFVLNPWRLVDAATVLLPLITLLPQASDWLRSSPVLRLVRLARAIAMGARASGVVARQENKTVTSRAATPVQVKMLPGTAGTGPRAASWDEFVEWARHPGTEWYSISNVGPHNLAEVARGTGIPRDFIEAHLLATSYPHVESSRRNVSIFVWVPETAPAGPVERNALLLIVSDKSVVSFARRPAHLMEKIAHGAIPALAALPFPVRTTCQLLKAVIDANEKLVGLLEDELRLLEDLPVRESRPAFFERTFRLKKELSAAQADLWRFRGVLKDLAEGRVKLPAGGAAELPFLADLLGTADYLYETVNNVREGVLSLIELHLNVVSFEMNRVMRVLAVVSVLGLIPAVVGGLFGMNLADNPWPFTLGQVTFVVGTGMITCLYFFVMKGWLR